MCSFDPDVMRAPMGPSRLPSFLGAMNWQQFLLVVHSKLRIYLGSVYGSVLVNDCAFTGQEITPLQMAIWPKVFAELSLLSHICIPERVNRHSIRNNHTEK
jgi:hypothetical protein